MIVRDALLDKSPLVFDPFAIRIYQNYAFLFGLLICANLPSKWTLFYPFIDVILKRAGSSHARGADPKDFADTVKNLL
jgi:hypothetical protein